MTGKKALDVEELLELLVTTDSRNPDLAPGSQGEGPIAELVAGILRDLGLETTLVPVLDGRSNVVGVLPGVDSDVTVIFEAHLDTVPASPETMLVRREGRRLYGRGSSDAKGSLAAMICATERLARQGGPRPTVVVVGVCDEEYIMRGAESMAIDLPTADVVVIGEPTSLVPARAHNGFIRFSVTVIGLAAHSSRAELGINAISQASALVLALDQTVGERLRSQPHPLTGPALLSATIISGGTAPNIVPDRCTILFDRRLSPGETPEEALEEIDREIAAASARDGIRAERAEPLIALAGLDTPVESIAVQAAEQASSRVLGNTVVAIGVTYSTDACRLAGRPDLPSVILGPGSIDQAHADVEWIELDEVVAACGLYADLAMTVHRIRGGA
jgi:acetylornithine deacetylase